ncbi:MAG: hypothetical protein JJ957_04470 [Pseudomonadales bacterium]|nr:hypothetical protein [Pseudomonadales bacterium]MBO6595072.1 hypothetical protein [Pseudomonadales bacterium]MBO6821369.1 hypothetical protein [Pseudomonadales bacterium]
MKSPLTLAFTHVAVATLAIVAAYFMLPGYQSNHPVNPKDFDIHEQVQAPERPAPLIRPEVMTEPVSIDVDDGLFGQQYAAHELAAQSTQTELIELLDKYVASDDPFHSGNLALVFLERLIEIDVEAALAYAETAPSQKRQLLLGSVYTSWARIDPESMSQSFAEIRDMSTRYQIGVRLLMDTTFVASNYDDRIRMALGPHGQAIVQHTDNMRRSPEESFRAALNSQGMRRSSEISQALGRWYESEPEAALNALDALDPKDQMAALAGVVVTASQSSFLGGYELVQKYAPENLQLLGTTLSMMVTVDPERGLPYLKRHFEETGNVGLMSQAMMGWASTDITSAVAYVNRLPNHVRANIEPTLAHYYVRENPTEAVAWARKSGSPQLMQSVASRLAHTDLGAAERWLSEAESPEIQATLLRDIAQQKTQLGLDEAMSWLDDYKDNQAYDQAAITIISIYSQADPERSAQFLSALDETEGLGPAYNSIATTWAYSDTESAENWVRSLPAGQNRDFATMGLIQSLAMNNPEEAVSLIDDLQPENPDRMRQFVAQRLYMQNGNIETAIRLTGLKGEAAEAFRNNPPGRGQILHAAPNATIISGGY